MTKIARKSMAKIARMAKINGKNGEFFSPLFHGENQEKSINGEW